MNQIQIKPLNDPEYLQSVHMLQKEAQKNPFVPGNRLVRPEDTRPVYDNQIGCMRYYYPLSEVNDFAVFCYVEKKSAADTDCPWGLMSHPDITMYVYPLHGSGKLILGEGNPCLQIEEYSFNALDLLIIPHGMPYRLEGDWEGVMFHGRSSCFGVSAGMDHLYCPTLYLNKPHRKTQAESKALFEARTMVLTDSTGQIGCAYSVPATDWRVFQDTRYQREDLNAIPVRDGLELHRLLTPYDAQSSDADVNAEAKKNPSIMGARVLRRSDAENLYNPHVHNLQWAYPLSWTDDMAIIPGFVHRGSVTDTDEPFPSHGHPEIEEYKFVLSGTGVQRFGVDDDTCNEERYDFKAGDLIINPRGIPHLDSGDFSAITFHLKTNVFGRMPGEIRYPHTALMYNSPNRQGDAKAGQIAANTYLMLNSRETDTVRLPNPYLFAQKQETTLGIKPSKPELYKDDIDE